MEGNNNRRTDNGHIDTKAQPRQKCAFVCTMIASIGRGVWEEERCEEGLGEEEVVRRISVIAISSLQTCLSRPQGLTPRHEQLLCSKG